MPEHSHRDGNDNGRDRQGARQPPKPGGRIVVVDWNAAIERPVGPPRDHVYLATEARSRLERLGLRVTEEAPLEYHYVLTAERP